MLTWILISVAVAAVVFALGMVQRKRSGDGTPPRWANPLAAIGLTVSTVGGILFDGLESIYLWAGGLGLFFIGFFLERIGEIQKEIKRTKDIDY